MWAICRTPRGVRGLKSENPTVRIHPQVSHPVWGAWIEINMVFKSSLGVIVSHPVWGAWIEMCPLIGVGRTMRVAPRVGCVD